MSGLVIQILVSRTRFWGTLPQLSSSSPSRLYLNRAFKWTWKPETSKVSWLWLGLVCQAGRGTGQGGCPGAAPSLFHFTGLTPLHTATLALNAAMPLPSVCPRMLSPQARDRLACVQMLLQMGASHTSQVSLGGGGWEGALKHRLTWPRLPV